MNKKRNSNIELLRIISILMVVISHYSVHNCIENSLLPLGINRFLLEIFSLGNIGVILFVMITGYFMIENKNEGRVIKLLVLYMQVLFYSLGVYLIFTLFGYEVFSIKELIKYMFPFIFCRYWFVNAYIILYLLSPFINKFLNDLIKKDYLKYLLLLLVLFSILPTFTKMNFYGNEIIQFILFYSLGAFFKKYPDNIFKNKKFNWLTLVISVILLLLSVVVIDMLENYYSFDYIDSIYFFSRNSSLAILFSVSFFNLFINKKMYYSKFINTLSSLVFGIYLLSDHNIVRKFLWFDLLNNAKYVLSNYFILHFIFSILLVFIICGIVEFVRKNTLERFILYVLNNKNYVFFDNLKDWYCKKVLSNFDDKSKL